MRFPHVKPQWEASEEVGMGCGGEDSVLWSFLGANSLVVGAGFWSQPCSDRDLS